MWLQLLLTHLPAPTFRARSRVLKKDQGKELCAVRCTLNPQLYWLIHFPGTTGKNSSDVTSTVV
jgi:hypothetical protein